MADESLNVSDVKEETVCYLPLLLDGKFFKVTSEEGDKIVAKCVNCFNKTISGSRRATTNFLRHLKVRVFHS